ncbi:transposase [Acidocella aminolytica]|uniref:transposase n=1 Tax=Acidocella aminolytica TaxID=33998 RepID=UPI00130DFDFC|nr:transposase [Acidocella aminolytica]
MDEIFQEAALRSAPELGYDVLPGVSKRRIWSTEEKLRILAQSTAPGSSVKLTCHAHGISSGQFYTWRKQLRHGGLSGFMPVSVVPEPVSRLAVAAVSDDLQPELPTSPGPVEVELLSGIKLRISGHVEAAATFQKA